MPNKDAIAVTFGELSVDDHFKLYPNSPELRKVDGIIFNAYNPQEGTLHYIDANRQVIRIA